jgi:riboflavin kinase/FMN adenylyltransferase
MGHASDLRQLQLQGCALTIGSFDGVHRGHQALIEAMREAQPGLPLVVLTFFPHPSVVLRERRPAFYITSPEEKAALLDELGVDLVVTQPFDRNLSRVEAEDFLDLLDRHLGFRSLWAGEDFALGYQRRGNRHFLAQAGRERGFEFHLVPPFKLEGEVVSSTRVREALRSGDVARAADYLGRRFRLPGTVQRGAGRGKGLGIPTANLRIWEERAHPGNGVYACRAQVGSDVWPAVVNIGTRPTFEGSETATVVEAHLLDYAGGDLYDQELALAFFERLRGERRFPGPEALLEQIQRDIARARGILG